MLYVPRTLSVKATPRRRCSTVGVRRAAEDEKEQKRKRRRM
jgi:hypothetical protein